jgi:hypothetical protein
MNFFFIIFHNNPFLLTSLKDTSLTATRTTFFIRCAKNISFLLITGVEPVTLALLAPRSNQLS